RPGSEEVGERWGREPVYQSPMPLWGAPGHENGGGAMLRGGRPGSEEVGERWGREPVYQSDRGYPEAPPIVAPRVGSTHGRVYSDRVPRSAVTNDKGRTME